jgi:hypothetical protein
MALALEDHTRRFARETRGRDFSAPLNIDSRGVYYQCFVPPAFQLGLTPDGVPAAPKSIRGSIPGSGQYVQLRPYDDVLPVASRIELETSLALVPYTTPLLFSIAGTNYPVSITPDAPQFPNRISLVLTGLGPSDSAVEVTVTGTAWPAPGDGQQIAPDVVNVPGPPGAPTGAPRWAALSPLTGNTPSGIRAGEAQISSRFSILLPG